MLDGRGGGGGAGRPGKEGTDRPVDWVDGELAEGILGTGREIGDALTGDSIVGEPLLGGIAGRAGVVGGLELRTGGGARRGTGEFPGGVGTDLGGGAGTARPGKLGGVREGRLGGSAGGSDAAGVLRGRGIGLDGVLGGRAGVGGGTARVEAGVGTGLTGAGGGGVGVGTARAGAGGGTARPGAGGGTALPGTEGPILDDFDTDGASSSSSA